LSLGQRCALWRKTMSLRKIITIDEERCTGCGECIPNCPEGALQIIDGKARLVSDLFCDGLGACVGKCPEDAMSVEERAAEPYDERKVMENVIRHGPNTIKAHLDHLKGHGAEDYFREAVAFLKERGIQLPTAPPAAAVTGHQCPGSLARTLRERADADETPSAAPCAGLTPSRLGNWPVQLKLVPVAAPYFQGARLLIAADCTAFAFADFHREFLDGRVLLIACPKLDDADFYRQKLGQILAQNDLQSVEVLHMEVPCCSGLVQIVRNALADAGSDVPVNTIEISLQGDILEKTQLQPTPTEVSQ